MAERPGQLNESSELRAVQEVNWNAVSCTASARSLKQTWRLNGAKASTANSDQHMKSLFMRRVWSYVGKY